MKKIRTKIIIAYLLVAVTGFIGSDFMVSWRIGAYLQQRIIDELDRQSDVILSMFLNDSTVSGEKTYQALQQLGSIHHLRITLIDSAGRVTADSDVPYEQTNLLTNHLDRPEVQQALRNGVGSNIRTSATLDRPFLYHVRMVHDHAVFGGRPISFIRLSVPLEDVDGQINQVHSIIIVIGIFTLIAIFAVVFFVSKKMSTPLEEIAAGVEEIRKGKLDRRLPVKSVDEIGRVAAAINELVDSLQKDIVERKKLEQVRSQFLGNVSHEIRTPIFSVQGFLETLADGAVDDPAVNRTFVQKALSNLSRLSVLLEDLINISQIESGELKMSFRWFRVNEFLESTTALHQAAATARNISLRVRMETSPSDEIYGDKNRLQQVMNNLIVNAINYNKPDGSVEVASIRRGKLLEISVSDTGVGIEPEHLHRVFERFYRVDSVRSRERGGTGLGLAIVKHIIEAHESQISIESRPGEGTTFRFTLKAMS
ncbi:MAG TPA: ATP-binding protein [Bacteroidota bacterium]|nr:ATP-binding protein [Bacteroidota bacterium]